MPTQESNVPAIHESERDCAYRINPFFRLACCPNEKQRLNGRKQISLLRNNEQPGAGTASEEFREVRGHRFPVVGDKDSPVLRSDRQSFDVIQPAQASLLCCLEIHSRLAAQDAGNDVLIEISVCLESNLHVRGACVSWRASSSFLNKRGLALRTFWRSASNSDSPCRK